MSHITTHILDTARGKPAQGICIILYSEQNNWKETARGITNEDGRIPNLIDKGVTLTPGFYKMKFETQAYFDLLSVQTFYPFVEITFKIAGSEHYHIPLLLSPFGYSTYRGS